MSNKREKNGERRTTVMADEPVREMTASSCAVGHDVSGLKIAEEPGLGLHGTTQDCTGTKLTKGRRRKPQQRPA